MKSTALFLALLFTVGSPAPALAYLKFGVRLSSGIVDVRWPGPVPYFVTERSIPEISATQLRDAVSRAFATWQAAPNASVQGQFQGFTTAPPGIPDQRSTIGFLDRPDLDRVLGATSFLLDLTTGEIRESDIFFNTRFTWSVAPNGEPGRVDLESVALHEVGHLLGLGHSALGETEMIDGGGRRVIASGSIMFPIAFTPGATAERVLQPDDIAGISEIYPASQFSSSMSSISGRITKNGQGIFGAHAVAVNLATGELVGGFSLDDDGAYVIGGLTPGAYLVRVEPLDDAATDSFFSGPVDVNFQVTYGSRVVIAPTGGGSDPLHVDVRPK
jgi:hypothetical protein